MKTLEKLDLRTLADDEMDGVTGGWFFFGLGTATGSTSTTQPKKKIERFDDCGPEHANADGFYRFC
jgi:hypothetical protein